MPGLPLNITLPVVGVTPGPEYATLVVSAFQAIIADLEALVTPDEIDINSDLSFTSASTSYSAIDLKTVAFESQSSALSGGNPRRIFSTGGELYYQDSSGNNVQLTAGGAVNVATVGAINSTGSPAYGDSDIEVLWSGPDSEYRFKQGSGADDLANIVVGAVELGFGSRRTTLDTAAVSDYPFTFPASQAGADNSIIQVSSAGQASFSRDLAIDNIVADSDIEATGNIEGDGLYHSGNETLAIFAMDMYLPADNGTGKPALPSHLANYFAYTGGGASNLPVVARLQTHLPDGAVVSSIALNYWGVDTWQLDFYKYVASTNTDSIEDTDSWTGGGGSSASPLTRTWAVSETVSGYSDNAFYVLITPPSAAAAQVGIISLHVTYTRPKP